MFLGCPEHCNAEGTHNEDFWNIACRLGSSFKQQLIQNLQQLTTT